MSYITKDKAQMFKDERNKITVNKELLAFASDFDDVYFANDLNWKKIVLHFKHETSNQKKVIVLMHDSNSGWFEATQMARTGAWKVDRIQISDKDGGSTVLERSNIPNADDATVQTVLKIAPFERILSFIDATNFTIAADKVEFYEVGYKIRVYDMVADANHNDTVYTITAIEGNQITLDMPVNAYADKVLALKFPEFKNSSARQRSLFQYIGKTFGEAIIPDAVVFPPGYVPPTEGPGAPEEEIGTGAPIVSLLASGVTSLSNLNRVGSTEEHLLNMKQGEYIKIFRHDGSVLEQLPSIGLYNDLMTKVQVVEGKLYFSINNTIYRYDEQGLKSVSIPSTYVISSNLAEHAVINGRYYFKTEINQYTEDRLLVIDEDFQTFSEVSFAFEGRFQGTGRFAKTGHLYYSTYSKIYCLDLATNTSQILYTLSGAYWALSITAMHVNDSEVFMAISYNDEDYNQYSQLLRSVNFQECEVVYDGEGTPAFIGTKDNRTFLLAKTAANDYLQRICVIDNGVISNFVEFRTGGDSFNGTPAIIGDKMYAFSQSTVTTAWGLYIIDLFAPFSYEFKTTVDGSSSLAYGSFYAKTDGKNILFQMTVSGYPRLMRLVEGNLETIPTPEGPTAGRALNGFFSFNGDEWIYAYTNDNLTYNLVNLTFAN